MWPAWWAASVRCKEFLDSKKFPNVWAPGGCLFLQLTIFNMKYRLPTVLLLLGVLSLSFCKKEAALPGSRLHKGAEATLSWRECVEFQDFDLTLCFENAKEYRCPCWAECVWEGAVDFTLRVNGPGVDTSVTLTTNSYPLEEWHIVRIGNTTIDISDATHPDCSTYADYPKYKVNVTLSR